MNPAAQPKADCYSAGERGWMEWTQRLRRRLFAPALRLLERARVSPDQLTLLSLIAGLFFFPLLFWSPTAALIALGLHALIDGLDGPLARKLGTASRRGSFLDTFCDQLVVTVSTFALVKAGIAGPMAGGFYVFVYAMVVFFAMVRNALEIPYPVLLRPRFIVYAWMIVEFYCLPGTMDIVLWIFTLILGFKMGTGFNKIRRRI